MPKFLRMFLMAGVFQFGIFLPAILLAVGSMDWSEPDPQPAHFTTYVLRAVFLGLAFMGTVYLVDSRLIKQQGYTSKFHSLIFLGVTVAFVSFFSLKQTHSGQPQIFTRPLEALEAILRILVLAVILQAAWLVSYGKPRVNRESDPQAIMEHQDSSRPR